MELVSHQSDKTLILLLILLKYAFTSGFPMKFDCRIFDYFLCWIHRQTKELSGPRSVLCSLILKDCRQKKLHDSQNYFIICPLPLSLSPNWHHHNLYLPSTMTNNDHHICTNHGFPFPKKKPISCRHGSRSARSGRRSGRSGAFLSTRSKLLASFLCGRCVFCLGLGI